MDKRIAGLGNPPRWRRSIPHGDPPARRFGNPPRWKRSIPHGDPPPRQFGEFAAVEAVDHL
jgi:hypothetical protein